MEKKTSVLAVLEILRQESDRDHPGFQHLQLNKSSKYRRNAVFFCQIPLSFTLYMLYNYGGLYLIWR